MFILTSREEGGVEWSVLLLGTLKASFSKYIVDRPIIDTFPNQLVVLNLHSKKIRHATFEKILAALRTLAMTSTSTFGHLLRFSSSNG